MPGFLRCVSVDLSAPEIRVLGCLLEKQRTTPDAYPLSLNALRLACNQSTNRDPVVDYDEATIRDALHRLARRRWTRLASGAGSRAAKYRHLLAEALRMTADEQAVLCVLMLRGAQTPGELKQRGERMHPFADLGRCSATLERLIERGLAARAARAARARRRSATPSCSATRRCSPARPCRPRRPRRGASRRRLRRRPRPGGPVARRSAPSRRGDRGPARQTLFPGMVRQGQLVVLAVQRVGTDVGLRPVVIAEGDAVLYYGQWRAVESLAASRDVLVVNSAGNGAAADGTPGTHGTSGNRGAGRHGRAAGHRIVPPARRADGRRGDGRAAGGDPTAGVPGGLVADGRADRRASSRCRWRSSPAGPPNLVAEGWWTSVGSGPRGCCWRCSC